MLEGQRVARFIFDELTGDSGAGGVSTLLGGRIYPRRVPQAAALPALVVQPVSSIPANTIGGRRVFANVSADVHLIFAGGQDSDLLTIGDRIDTVLQGAQGLQDGGTIVKLVRTAEHEYDEDDNSKSYTHVVLTYGTPAYA